MSLYLVRKGRGIFGQEYPYFGQTEQIIGPVSSFGVWR